MSAKLVRTRRPLVWLAAGLCTTFAIGVRGYAERPPAAKLLPHCTAVLLSVADVPEMSKRFTNTAMGRMSQDRQLRPLMDHLYGSLAGAVAGMQDRIGLSLPQLLAIPQGELTLALVAPDQQPPALVILLDAGSRLSDARELLRRATDALEQSGAEKSEQTITGTKLVAYDRVGPRRRKLVLFEKDTTVVVGSDLEVLKQLLYAWNGKESATLSDNRKFAAVMDRCRGAPGEEPQLRWYVDPIMIMQSIAQTNTGLRITLALLPALGLDGLAALGGSLALDVGTFDTISHIHLLLDSPRTGVLEMLALDSGDTEPESWVPYDVASYTTLHWEIDKTFKTLTELYDSFRGEGALSREMERRIKTPIGLDFEQDLLPALKGRITHVTWVQRPVTPTSQASLVAFKLSDAASVEVVLEKVFKQNEVFLSRRPYAGRQYYQFTPPQLSDLPRDRPVPRPCFGVLDDYLMITDRESLYQKVIVTARDPSESLAQALDFKLIASKIQRRSGGTKPAMINFSRPEEGMRILYEVALADRTRQQLRKRAERNPLLKSLNAALEANPLPPFAVLERYLAPHGGMVVDDKSGIHYTTFSLKRKLE